MYFSKILGAAFSLLATDGGNRLNVVITLVLTVVAFKYSVAQNIPKVKILKQILT